MADDNNGLFSRAKSRLSSARDKGGEFFDRAESTARRVDRTATRAEMRIDDARDRAGEFQSRVGDVTDAAGGALASAESATGSALDATIGEPPENSVDDLFGPGSGPVGPVDPPTETERRGSLDPVTGFDDPGNVGPVDPPTETERRGSLDPVTDIDNTGTGLGGIDPFDDDI